MKKEEASAVPKEKKLWYGRRFLFNRGISPNDPIRRMISLALMDDAKFVFLFVEIADRASL